MLPTPSIAANPLSTSAKLGANLLAAFYASLSPNTLDAYRSDLADFATHLGTTDVETAARRLLNGSPGEANALALVYRSAMAEAGRSPATINRRLSAVRSLVSLARTLGLVAWMLEIKNVRSESYRDTRGPRVGGVEALLAVARRQERRKAARDVAMARLMFDLALRRGEVVALDLLDIDVAGRRVWVKGKGRREKVPLTMPDQTLAATVSWLSVRGVEPGPLFSNYDVSGKGAADRRLTGQGLWTVVRTLGRAAGIEVRPHGLRHASITSALDLTRGDVRAVQKHSRHASVAVLMRYDDNRSDLAGAVAAMVAGTITGEP
jgi:integrase/recombinase XerC